MECATEMEKLPSKHLDPESEWRTPQYLESGILLTLQLAEASGSPVTVYLCTNFDCRAQAAILGEVKEAKE